MSYKKLMAHRCSIMRQTVDLKTGSAEYTWQTAFTNVPCFVDLNYVRTGKDPMWTSESGRTTDRTGVCFFLGNAPIKNGDWIKITKGPAGVFSIETAIDEAWRPSSKHHIEVAVKEIPKQLAKGVTGAPKQPNEAVPTFPAQQREELDDVSAMDPSVDPFSDIPGMN